MASKRPILQAERLTDYLLGSLDFRGGNWLQQEDDALDRALAWYRSLAAAGHTDASLAVVGDIGFLVLQRSNFAFCSLTDIDNWPDAERQTRLDYENLVLNRLLRSPAFVRAAEIVAVAAEVAQGRSDGAEDRRGSIDAQVVRVIELVLAAMDGLPPLPFRFSPTSLREITLVSGTVAAIRAAAAARERFERGQTDLFRGRVADVVAAFGGVAISEIFHDEQFHEIENFHAYESPLARRKGRWLKAVQRTVGEVDLRRQNVAPEAAEAETELEDEGYYPTGGLAELTNRGSFENLVPSEAVYMEDPGSDEVDLFTVRHVEGELLYYMRDSGQLRRRRRTVHLVIDGGDSLRIKHRHHQYALDVMIYGFVLRLAEDLARVFERDSLRTCIHVITERGTGSGQDAEEDQADRGLLNLLLRHEIHRGEAAIAFVLSVTPEEIIERGRRNYLVHIASDGGDPDIIASARDSRMRAMSVRLSSGDEPPESPSGPGTEETPAVLDLSREILPELARTRDRIVDWVLGIV